MYFDLQTEIQTEISDCIVRVHGAWPHKGTKSQCYFMLFVTGSLRYDLQLIEQEAQMFSQAKSSEWSFAAVGKGF